MLQFENGTQKTCSRESFRPEKKAPREIEEEDDRMDEKQEENEQMDEEEIDLDEKLKVNELINDDQRSIVENGHKNIEDPSLNHKIERRRNGRRFDRSSIYVTEFGDASDGEEEDDKYNQNNHNNITNENGRDADYEYELYQNRGRKRRNARRNNHAKVSNSKDNTSPVLLSAKVEPNQDEISPVMGKRRRGRPRKYIKE